MRVIQHGPAILGDGVLRDFARSLQAADLSAATRRGYAADLGRFRSWIDDGRSDDAPEEDHGRLGQRRGIAGRPGR